MKHFVAYLVGFAAFVAADMLWLGVMTPRLYRPTLSDILSATVNIPPAIAFYLLYPVGVVVFAISPALKSDSIAAAVIYGCLFGFFTYSTYDLSNYATLRNWSLPLTVLDIGWGTILTGFAAAISFWGTSRLLS